MKSCRCKVSSFAMSLNSYIDLPRELWQEVGAHLQPKDLLSLGQVRCVFYTVLDDQGCDCYRRLVEPSEKSSTTSTSGDAPPSDSPAHGASHPRPPILPSPRSTAGLWVLIAGISSSLRTHVLQAPNASHSSQSQLSPSTRYCSGGTEVVAPQISN